MSKCRRKLPQSKHIIKCYITYNEKGNWKNGLFNQHLESQLKDILTWKKLDCLTASKGDASACAKLGSLCPPPPPRQIHIYSFYDFENIFFFLGMDFFFDFFLGEGGYRFTTLPPPPPKQHGFRSSWFRDFFLVFFFYITLLPDPTPTDNLDNSVWTANKVQTFISLSLRHEMCVCILQIWWCD